MVWVSNLIFTCLGDLILNPRTPSSSIGENEGNVGSVGWGAVNLVVGVR